MNNNEDETFIIPDRIEAAKKDLASYTREQLLRRTYDFQSDDHRKAAILLLAEMDKRDSDKKHRWLFIFAILTFLITAASLVLGFFQYRQSKATTIQNKLEVQSQPATQLPSPPLKSQGKENKDKQKTQSIKPE